MKTAVITGITSQDGAYLSKLLLEKEYRVIGLTRGSMDLYPKGLSYLGIKEVEIEECNLLDSTNIMMVLEKYHPDEVYNLAAQSSVGASFSQPSGTIEFNVMTVLNLLESIRRFDDKIKFYQASSSEMFGRVKELPVTDKTPMHPLSPYAISKATAHWITTNYREAFGLYACCGILFNHESPLRRKNFFTKKIIGEGLEVKQGKRKFIRVGNIDIRRDFGYGPEYVKAMWLMLQAKKPDDYMICSGKSVSLREIVQHIFKRIGIPDEALIVDESLYRPAEILDIYGSNEKAERELGWKYNLDFFDVLDELISEEISNNSLLT